MNWYAMSQGREVFAIPGKVDSATSVGTNRLIKQGAKLIETVEDVLEELKTTLKECLTLEKENKATEPVTVKKEKEDTLSSVLSEDESAVYGLISDTPRYADEIIEQASLSSSRVIAVLLKLEMEHVITQLPGKMFIRKGV